MRALSIFAAAAMMAFLPQTLSAGPAESILGKWITYDKKGNEQSEVVIYTSGQGYSCKVLRLLGSYAGKYGNDPVCEKCPGEYRDQPVVGIEIIKGMTLEGDTFKGKILSPEKAGVYRMTMRFAPSGEDELLVSGYLGPFSETVRWKRAAE